MPNVRSLAMPKPAQRGRRHDACAVLDAAVVEDVEHVDLLALGRLRADREQRSVDLAGEHDAVVEAAIGTGDAALEGDRATQLRQHVRGGRVALRTLPHERDLEVDVGGELDPLQLVPVVGRERHCGGDAVDLDEAGAGCDRRRDRELERVVVRQVVATDDGDLVVTGVGTGEADPLALEEAVGEPSGAVGATDAVDRIGRRAGDGELDVSAPLADHPQDADRGPGVCGRWRATCQRPSAPCR